MTLVASVVCTTTDGVTVDGAEYTTGTVAADMFELNSGAKNGTRCSEGAYLGDYRVKGEATGQLGCNGDEGTVAWTVPSLRMYLSATGLSMPEMYQWWKRHWTVGSVASAGTTGEKAVPIQEPVAEAPEEEAPEPDDTSEEPDASISVLAGITDLDVLAAGYDAGLDCEVDPFGVTCEGTTSLGANVSLVSSGSAGGVEDVTVFTNGDAAEGYRFLTFVARALLGSSGSSVVGWIGANADADVVDKNFGAYHVTYRGPLDFADVFIEPAG